MNAPRWRHSPDLADALGRVGAGATAVGGGTTLLSDAFAPVIGAEACDLAGLLPEGLADDVLGGATTLDALAADPEVRARWPAVAAAAALTATPQVRRLATLGGTIAARLPTADLPAALVAHGAEVHLVAGPAGERRRLPLAEHLARPTPDPHLVVAVRLTRPGRGAYRRFALRRGPAPAIATVAGVVDRAGRLHLHAGAVGPGVAPVPVTAGERPRAEALRSDVRASARHRARLVEALAREVASELGHPW